MKNEILRQAQVTERNDQDDKLIEYLIFKQWNIF